MYAGCCCPVVEAIVARYVVVCCCRVVSSRIKSLKHKGLRHTSIQRLISDTDRK